MNTNFGYQKKMRQTALLMLLASATLAQAALVIPDTPLISTRISKPLTMIVAGKDHKLFYEAYNDAGDIDGDGVIDVRFKPGITYYGLFDSGLCYEHNGKSNNTGLFTPADTAGANNTCTGKKGSWSGNFLNYLTTSRVDALRKVLYGGYREIDTKDQTVLRRAYIPQDAHSWGKEYTSEAVDKYKISDYTPLAQPDAGKRHFFGSLTNTDGVNCKVLTHCSDRAPWLSVVTNTSNRIWDWASSERPVLRNDTHGGTRKNYAVRVEVCTATFSGGCKKYTNGNFKPVGLLHDYGENDAMLFGLLTGSYDRNMSGGILRKVISSFKDEVDASTGVFTAQAKIVKTFNALRIRDFNNDNTDNNYRNGWVTDRAMKEGEFMDWGNPIGEMMYEALRYFSGAKAATPGYTFDAKDSVDESMGLPFATWDDPYSSKDSAAKAPYCAKPNLLTISDINPSFDSDQVPGSVFAKFDTKTSSLGTFSAETYADRIASGESSVKGKHYIGQNCKVNATCYDGAPTAKDVTSLSNIRGLAPEEPTKQGSYYSAAVAYYGKINDLRSDIKEAQTSDTYAVALASHLPKIEVPVGAAKITLVPFAKSVKEAGGAIDTNGDFQPTNQIVDFYVDTIANSSAKDKDDTINSGRYYAKFRINYEDVEQGADHDMDAIAEYEIYLNADNKLVVKVMPTYQFGGIQQNMGYIISGTKKDGIYLVVTDESWKTNYRLNTPDGVDPGGCKPDALKNFPAGCDNLPYIDQYGKDKHGSSTRTFEAGGSAATLLKDPLWYAAKWGGYVKDEAAHKTDQLATNEWDTNSDGVPDSYFLVQNPLKLKESLNKSFDNIIKRSASAGNITSNTQELTSGSKIFQTAYNATKWDGELKAWEISAAGISAAPKWVGSEEIQNGVTDKSRVFLTWNTTTNAGVLFGANMATNWSALSTTQQTLLGSVDVLSYILGDQSKEPGFRSRSVLLGDIVNSSPFYVKDSATTAVYVGSNDGMLHAFNSETGKELFAYIPGQVYPKLKDLSATNYSHKFFVDGEIAVSSRTLTTGANYLVASLGRGAPGLFALDVSDPTKMTDKSVLWEYSAIVNSDADMGYSLGQPQLGKLNNDVVAAVVSNGYNSANGKAVLIVLDLKTGAVIKKLDTGEGSDNGLSTPRLWDADNDGKADYVYAGDLKGNVWKFNLKDKDPAKWAVDNGGKPLFVAKKDGDVQPITSQILVAINTLKDDPNVGKTFLSFGTGSYFFSNDPDDKKVQSLYGIIDSGTTISDRSSLKERTIVKQEEVTFTRTVVDGGGKSSEITSKKNVRVFSSAVADPNDMTGKSGWYIDLFYLSANGERVVSSAQLVPGLEPTLLVSSVVPTTNDPCDPGGSGFVNMVNAFTGASLKDVFVDLNGDGKFDKADMIDGSYVVGGFDPGVQMPGKGVVVGDKVVIGGSDGGIKDFKINLGKKVTGRVSWREIRAQ